MKRFLLYSLAVVVFTSWFSCPLWAAEQLSSSIGDQKNVELTVYNSNVALVKDTRQLRLSRGLVEVRFKDVASQIIPTSVSIRAVSAPDGFSILEQNYEYDLLSPKKLLDKYVGKKVKLITRNPYTDKEETVEATVLSNNEGNPVYQIGNEVTFNHPGRLIFPEIPGNLISRPTLLWLLDSRTDGPKAVEVLYLTSGVNWRADYVLVLDSKDTNAGLSGWVTIDNRSGTAYRDAKLKLVAGDINRVREETRRDRMAYKAEAMPAAAAPQFKEESFFEYHIYTLDRRSTVKENQTKQISLLDAANIPVRKEFVYRGAVHYYQNRYGERIVNEKIAVYVELQNRKENNLGMPIPKGILRVYKHDSDGSLQFIGEDSVDHTPKDEKIRVKMGNAFDVKAARKQMTWEKISKDTIETSFEISVRNHKKEEIVVKVVEPLYGDWKVLESSLPYKKEDVNTIFFDVPVKKDGEVKLTYRVRVRH
jgi:hypothetical protein